MVESKSKRAPHTDFQVLLFVISLCFICAFLLAIVAYFLSGPQKEAKEFDESKQMLIAAKILNHSDVFQLLEEGKILPARYDLQQDVIVPTEGEPPQATVDEIKAISESRIRPLFTNAKGEVYTLEKMNLTLSEYLEKNQKAGYANLPNKLFYAILPNQADSRSITSEALAEDLSKAYALVIPISGFGLWGPIYGYLAIEPNGNSVIGTTWYDHGETPGLGANIASAQWQKQFFEKQIFQAPSGGSTDFQTANLGIIVVKGKVQDVYGSSPKAKSAVDGMSGATLTGDGVTAAYKNSLTPYRPLLIELHKESADDSAS